MTTMSPDRLLDLVGRPGGPLADASLWDCEVVESGVLGPSMQRLVLTAPGLEGLQWQPGQDLMFRIPRPGAEPLNRRYTIRRFRPAVPTVTVDVSLHGRGPGTEWVKAAGVGSRIQAIGPRGRITLDASADWHLFVADETGLPGSLAMIEALPAGSVAVARFEVDSPADEQLPADEHPTGDGGVTLDLAWLHRNGASAPGDASLLLDALAGTALPTGPGHAYLSAEAGVVRAIREALAGRGLGPDQVSAKAYWRRGLPNAEHGEPTGPD
jgi:NADPH-dependent ferric siderophore reductase